MANLCALNRNITTAVNVVECAPTALLLLDDESRVLAASPMFRQTLTERGCEVLGVPLYQLDRGRWNTPAIRQMIDKAVTDPLTEARCEVTTPAELSHSRYLSLSTRCVNEAANLLLAVTDVTDLRLAARDRALHNQERAALLQQLECQRAHIEDLCASVGVSITCANGSVSLRALADDTIANPRLSIQLGLIVTQLVLQALNRSYPNFLPGEVTLGYHPDGPGWALCLRDNEAEPTSEASRLDSIVFVQVATANALWLGPDSL